MPESWGPPPPPVFLRKVSETLEISPDFEVWSGWRFGGWVVGWGVLGVGFVKSRASGWWGIGRRADGVVAGWGAGWEWLAWAGATKEAIERCRVPLEDAGAALVVCWEEFLGFWLFSQKRTPSWLFGFGDEEPSAGWMVFLIWIVADV
jgi:hypothetical protein